MASLNKISNTQNNYTHTWKCT